MGAVFLLAVLSFVVISTTALGWNGLTPQQSTAREYLNQGVQAFKEGNFDRAIERFKRTKELDPSLLNARLYLATAYASQYIPGAPSEENIQHAKDAIAEFKSVRELEPNNLSAIDGIGSILFQMSGHPFDPKGFEESIAYHKKHIELNPEVPEPHYWVGLINWTLGYHGRMSLLEKWGIEDEPEALPVAFSREFAKQFGEKVDEGITKLKKAIELRAEYEDAIAYLNLLYRLKADMVESPTEREEYLRKADALVDRVKEIRKRKMEEPKPHNR